MHVTLVHVSVKPERVMEFIEATRTNHRASVQESGNLRFDVLQSPEDPTRFVLYEAYTDVVAAVAHKETAHYRRWRDQVADWMTQPRQGSSYRGLFPMIGVAE
ncbi:MAG: antibiotic biosynthesis monooxygenase [Thiohalobacteraceae bacterium]|nr:antibiotic biosynthesis monooxygenase [Gammaproteobacteria bacterium]